MCRFAHGARAPSWFPRPRRTSDDGAVRQVHIAADRTRYWERQTSRCRKLSRGLQLAAAYELLADLAHVAGRAVGPLGDHAVGLLRAAAQLELEERLAPGGPAVALGADGGLLDRLLALAVEAEPLAAPPAPALGPAGNRVAARCVADGHLAAGTGPAASAGRTGSVGGRGLGHELPPRSR